MCGLRAAFGGRGGGHGSQSAGPAGGGEKGLINRQRNEQDSWVKQPLLDGKAVSTKMHPILALGFVS